MKNINLTLREIAIKNPKDRKYLDYLDLLSEVKINSEFNKNLPIFKIAILRNFTIESLLPILEGEIYLAGFRPVIRIGDYDNVAFESMSSNSYINDFKPDLILVINWLETISPILTNQFIKKTKEEIELEVKRIKNYYKDVQIGLRKKTTCPILISNFNLPVEPTLGIMDSQKTYYQFNTIQNINTQILLDSNKIDDVYILDIARIFTEIGSLYSIDQRNWQTSKAPLSYKSNLRISQEIGKFVKAFRGKTKKCLILDCDNTLWGGILGEEGIAGINLGSTFPGSCYKSFQEEILNLKERGVILAICSKNNEKDVLEVFNNHPEMVIKENHLSTWKINWENKAKNIEDIAKELNIGLDSIVFIDDSEFEINLIRDKLPDVATIHLKGNTSEYRNLILQYGYFDSLSFTEEDKNKNEMYRQSRAREKLKSSSSSIENYLKSLELEATIGVPLISDISRCSQLSQKTNQFNLTTLRYTEGQINELKASKDVDVFYLRLKDKIADLGLVGLVIVKYNEYEAEIEAFMMSCRAIGRGAENALLSFIAKRSKSQRNSKFLIGKYLYTSKNESLVGDFYKNNGFTLTKKIEKNTYWKLDLLNSEINYPEWIKINER